MSTADTIPPPHTDRDDVVEHLFGHSVADPYRWLEDEDSARTRDWVERQRAFTEPLLAALPGRDRFGDLMTAVTLRPRASTPRVSKGRYLRQVNSGGQLQDVVLVADSLDELLAGGRVLVDPNTWSEDGTVSLSALTVAPGGEHFAVARSEAGSDWMRVQVVDENGTAVEDHATTTKFCSPVWLPDGRSHLYNHFPEAGRADGSASAQLGSAQLRVHTVGADDWTVVDFTDEPQARAWPVVSDDDAWLVLHVHVGTERTTRVWLYPLTPDSDGRSRVGERVDLVPEATAAWSYVGSRDGELLFLTDLDAPLGRVVALRPEGGLREVVAEQSVTLLQAELAADVLLASTLVDATPVVQRLSLDGTCLGSLDLPGGAVVALNTSDNSPEAFIGMSTLVDREAAFRVDAATGEVTALAGPAETPGVESWQPPRYSIERRRATSSDGAQVPYFLVLPEGIPDGPSPTILYGYGGFDIPILADFRATWPAWLAAGGKLVIANLRGGGEFGREWYDQGRREHKQQVFDDLFAVAEHIISEGVTTAQQLAVHGKSNGGLLSGAAIAQRPELFAAAIPHVGVLDVVRFHRFTIGSAWISDYGDPDDPAELERILTWSPLHTLVPGTRYPATLVATSDHDDRVVPAHSYKFAAELQHCQGGQAPIWIRIEPSTGHGLTDKPPAVLAAEGADLLAFAAHHTGLVVERG